MEHDDPALASAQTQSSPNIGSLQREMLERARQTAEDGAGGLQIASRRATAPVLRRVFAEQSVALGTATQRLATALMMLGLRPDEGASVRARFDRALLAVRSHLHRSDTRLLEQCIRMNRVVEGAITDAMSLGWPSDVRSALVDGLATARRCVAELESVGAETLPS